MRSKKKSNHLIDPSFQGVNKLFVLLFENEAGRAGNTGYYVLVVDLKDYNVMSES